MPTEDEGQQKEKRKGQLAKAQKRYRVAREADHLFPFTVYITANHQQKLDAAKEVAKKEGGVELNNSELMDRVLRQYFGERVNARLDALMKKGVRGQSEEDQVLARSLDGGCEVLEVFIDELLLALGRIKKCSDEREFTTVIRDCLLRVSCTVSTEIATALIELVLPAVRMQASSVGGDGFNFVMTGLS